LNKKSASISGLPTGVRLPCGAAVPANLKLALVPCPIALHAACSTAERVRERGKLRALTERGASVSEIEVSPMEFAAYCKGLKRPDFSIVSLDRYAREKAIAQWERVTTSPSGAVAQSAVAA
jgi:hypothetical protein